MRTHQSLVVLIAVLSLALASCASEVPRQPERLSPLASNDSVERKVVRQDIHAKLGSGYERLIGYGTRWELVGSISQGKVYKCLNTAFTIEGANIHEAYLVANDGKLVGFYLPVERAFSPLESKYDLNWEQE